MEQHPGDAPRAALVAEAGTVAGLLDAFNREFGTPTPGTAVLAERLERLLAHKDVIALLAGDPAVGVALLTLRPNVWYDGRSPCSTSSTSRPGCAGKGVGRRCWVPPRP